MFIHIIDTSHWRKFKVFDPNTTNQLFRLSESCDGASNAFHDFFLASAREEKVSVKAFQ